MAVDKDYVLGVAVQLQTESVAAFEAEVRRQLEDAAARIEKGVKVRLNPLSPEQNQQLQKMLSDQQAIIDRSAADQKAANEKVAENWKQRTVSTGQQIDAETRVIQEKLAQQQAILDESAAKRKAALSSIAQGWEDNLVSGPDGSSLERQQKILDRYAPALNNAAQAQKGFAEQLLATSGAADHFVKSLGNIVTWSAGIGLVYGAGSGILKGFQDAIHSQQEQVIQGFYYKAQGQNFTPQMSSQTMQAAIDLARKYGDDVMQVQEAIGLWAKSTHGELMPSLEMANEALKLNAVTGMKNEEIYRSTISVLSQYHESLSKTNDIYNVAVGLAQRYGGGIKSLGGEAQDASRQMIEAMDSSSAVASSFGLKLEQTAALLAVMIQTGNKSGEEVGSGLSRALAAFERGKPEEALAKMGIAIHNNSQFLDELKAKWDQTVPGMGNTLGNIITQSVQSSALEPLKLMISSLGQYKEAYQQAVEYEKSHPLDTLWSQMQTTDATKLNQIKSSFEAISIVIGRQFLTPLADAINEVQKFVPTLISLGPAIAGVAKSIAEVGVAWGAVEGLKLLGNVVLTAAGQWKTFGASLSGESDVAITALTAQQRAEIAFLTNNATITSEAAAQWSAFAAKVGISNEAMIGELAKLKMAAQTSAASINESEDSIAVNMKSVAAQLGVEETEVVASFDGMAAGAARAATSISSAFLKAIPIIGQIAIVAGIATAAYGAWKNKEDKDYSLGLELDPAARKRDESNLMSDAASQRQRLNLLLQQYKTGRGPFMTTVTGERGLSVTASMGKNDLLDQIEQTRSKIAEDHTKYAQDVSGYRWNQYGSIDQQINAAKAGINKALSQPVVPPGGNEGGTPTPPGAAKAAAQALDAQSQAVKRNVDAWTAKVQTDEKAIQTARLMVQYTNDHAKAMEALTHSYNKVIGDIKGKIGADEGALGKYRSLASSTATEPQREKYLNDAARMANEINNLKAELKLIEAKEQLDLGKANAGQIETRVRGLMGGVSESMRGMSHDNLTQLSDLHKEINNLLYTVDQLAERFKGTALGNQMSALAQRLSGDLAAVDNRASDLKTKLNEINDAITGKISEFNQDITGNSLAMSTGQSWDKQFAQSMDSITSKFNTFEQEWEKWANTPGVDSTQLNNVQALAMAWYNSSVALAQYNRAMSEAKASPMYAAVTTLGNDLGSTFTSDVMNMFTQNDQNQVYALSTQITQLQAEKNMLTGQNNLVERNILDQKIKSLEAERSGLENQMKHPSFLKQIQEDMVKSIMKGLTDQFTKSLQDAFLQSILPKQETAQDKANTFIQSQTAAVQQNTAAINQLTQKWDSMGTMATSAGNNVDQYGIVGGVLGQYGSMQVTDAVANAVSANGSTPGRGFAFPAMTALGLSASSGSIGSGSGGVSGGGSSGSGSSSGSSFLGGATAILGASSLPSFLSGGGSGSSYSAAASPFSSIPGAANLGVNSDLVQAYMRAGMSPQDAISMASWVGSSGGGSSGGPRAGSFAAGGKGMTQNILGVAGGLATAVGGYDQGGFSGSLMAGLGMYSAGMSAAALAGVAASAAIPFVAPIAAAAFLFSLFHPHYNPSQNPDMYKDSGFAQGVANAQGTAYTQATGWVQEDTGLQQQLGGMTELQYLNTWYNQYPGGNGLNSQAKQLWDQIGHITGNGKGYGVTGLHQGNVFVSATGQNGSPQVGESGNWQTVLQDIDNATQQLFQLENQDMSGKGTWISVNSYGAGGGGSASFSPWNTPGMSSSDVSSIMAMPYPALGSNASISTSISPSSGSPSGGFGGGSYGPAPVGAQPMAVTSNVYLNSDLIAQQVNAFNIQRTTSGFAQNY